MDAAIGRLLEHRAEFLSFVRSQGASEAQAEDIVQTALMRGLEPWISAPAEGSLIPWFYRVLRNELTDQARRASAAGRALDRYSHEPSDAIAEEPRQVCKCTLKVLASLKHEYAQLIEAVDLEGWSVDAAARAAGITPNNAYVRLHRARKALRERLAAACGQCATGDGRCTDCYCHPADSL